MDSILPQVGQVVEFDVLSIILLVIILISVIIGAVRGLIGSIVAFISSFGSLFFASLFAESLGGVLYTTDLSKVIYDPIYSWVSTQGDGLFNQVITSDTSGELLVEAFTKLNIPEIFHEMLQELIVSMLPEMGSELATIISESLTMFACTAISFVLLWIVIFIVFKILEVFAKQFNEIPVLGTFNRFLGGLVGFGVGVCLCSLICYIVSLLVTLNIPFANDIVMSMQVENETIWTFSKMLYTNNFILALIELFM